MVFPVHNKNGDLIGVKGRSVNTDDEYKYLYLYSCNKSIELFNYHRAIEYINKYKKVYIGEGAKFTMLLTQWGYPNCVSIEGSDISQVQIYELKKLGIDIKYIFCYDKDKNEQYVKNQVKQIKNRIVKIMIDKDNLLQNKESPTDKGEYIFNDLVDNYVNII
jgi:DNA primase